MRIAVFAATAAHPFKVDALESFHRGLLAAGDAADLVTQPAYRPCDVAVIFGASRQEAAAPSEGGHAPGVVSELRQQVCAAHSGPLIHLETPFLGRSVYIRGSLMRWLAGAGLAPKRFRDKVASVNHYEHFRVGLNGVFPDTADFCAEGSPPDRWQRLSQDLDIRLRPWRRTGRHILLVGQMPRDASLGGADIFDWVAQSVATLRRHTDRPILLRPHPLTPATEMAALARRVSGARGLSIEMPPKGPISAALRGAWASVTFSSSAAVDSVIAGVPAFAQSPMSMAWPVSGHDLACIESPDLPAREQWLYDLCYAQWSPAEMATGRVWSRMRPAVLRSLGVSPPAPAPEGIG